METTEKKGALTRKKNLKSYRQRKTDPLPDFLKNIGSTSHGQAESVASHSPVREEEKRPLMRSPDGNSSRPLVRNMSPPEEEIINPDQVGEVAQNSSPPPTMAPPHSSPRSVGCNREKSHVVQPFPVYGGSSESFSHEEEPAAFSATRRVLPSINESEKPPSSQQEKVLPRGRVLQTAVEWSVQKSKDSFVQFLTAFFKKKRDVQAVGKVEKKSGEKTIRDRGLSQNSLQTDDLSSLVSQLKSKMFIMSKISFMGLLFGLILISCLFFTAGFMTALSMNPSGEMAGLAELEKLAGNPVAGVEEKSAWKSLMEKIVPASPPGAKKKEQVAPQVVDAQQFSIRIDDFSDLNAAKLKAVDLEKEGYGSYIVRVPDANGRTSSYSVRLGVFGDYLDASNFSRKLQSQGYTNAKVALIDQGEDRFAP